jgi:cellulose synthase (UDP-forming)
MDADFLNDIVPYLEQDSSLAFVQTPQLYDNADQTWLCRAAAQQETLLYDTILEAKSALGQALCCGTNFVMRRRALEEVGGWDEGSVSEDLSTSFLLNRVGWKSLYVRRPYAWGLGPLDLFAYWKQQARWAVGNTTVVKQVVKALFTRKPQPTPAGLGLGYLWSAGYYITALALAGLATLPILLLVASYVHSRHALQAVPAARPIEWLFLSVYPFYVTIMLFPYVNMRMRGYPLRNLVMLQGLLAVTVPVYVTSVIKGLVTRFTFFEIAPKGRVAKRHSLLGPQSLIFGILLISGCLLTVNVVNSPGSSVAWIVLFWTFFYTLSFGHYFIFVIQDRVTMKRAGQTASRQAGRTPSSVEEEVLSARVEETEADS